MNLHNKLLFPASALTLAGVAVLVLSNTAPSAAPAMRAEGEMMSRFGVNVHRFNQADADRMQQAGMRFVRLTMTWSRIEARRGVYDWKEADDRIDAITKRGMRPVIVLAYSNPLYAPPAAKRGNRSQWQPPVGGEAKAAFVNWARAAVARYSADNPVWEIWNEPDTDGFWPDKADPVAYAALALETCRNIRGMAPAAEVWGPGLSSWNNVSAATSPYFRAVLSTPLPSCLSAVSVHPYLHWSQIDAAPSYWRSVAGVPATTRRPLVSSESGISTYNARITAFTQASYLVRMLIYDHMADVRATLWYDWKDDGSNPADPEHHFGLLDSKGGDKPAMQALEQLASKTRGLDRQCLDRLDGLVRVYMWRKEAPNDLTVVAWRATNGFSTDPGGDVVIEASASRVDATDLLGAQAIVTRDRDNWHVGGGRMPYYVRYSGLPSPACR